QMRVPYYRGRKILVTGGTGSIGSEIIRQLLALKAGVVRIFSRDETKHYEFGERLGKRADVRFLVGDVRDKDRLRRAMEGVEIVFHAAALKHVPLCEYNPFEAVQTNVVGTQNVINAALDARVSRVIAISTDKALSPVSTMGASKLLAERVTVAADLFSPNLKLGCVRFGNVIGSRGSIVPLVKAQIERGGPVLITDPNMTRFMMSVADAASLVLEAGSLIRGGEIFILKMPVVRLGDLVEVLVDRFTGKKTAAGRKVRIQSIEPRYGEKMHHELLTEEEIPRTLDKGKVFVLHAYHRIERSAKLAAELKRSTMSGLIRPKDYRSDAATPLSRRAIAALLDRAKV
ncbi:MAG: SDR family NAD(P)-dependent oxidoreductase, partial [Planctomycetota bacterium]|nr:SDR family NAD(P)-dependent oxidoreductase [Planctomycetota bacterium]